MRQEKAVVNKQYFKYSAIFTVILTSNRTAQNKPYLWHEGFNSDINMT